MLTAIALCACLAVGCGVYLLSGGNDMRLALAAVAIVVGIALAAITIALYAQSSHVRGHMLQLRNEVRTSERYNRDSHNRTEYLAQQVLDIRNRSEQINATITAGFGELRENYTALAQQIRESARPDFMARPFAANQQAGFQPPPFAPAFRSERPAVFPNSVFGNHAAAAPPRYEPLYQQPAAEAAAAPAYNAEDYAEAIHAGAEAERGTSLADRLSTSLEPVIDLFTSKTTHYRLHLGMTREDGEEVNSETVLHHADRTGLRAGFDLHAARETLLLLRRLRQRDPSLSIFLPLGAHTLQSDDAIARLIALSAEYADVTPGLVLEIPHAMLAGLSEQGLEGLAKLARAGLVLSLANVSINGIDLPSLTKLNVRFVTLNVAAASGADGASQAAQHFAQSARSMRVHIIVTNVTDIRAVQKLTKITRFASGSAFAEPRKVRADATSTPAPGYSNVA